MKTILIAEDDENIAELERDYLKLNGYLADIEADGRAACRKALSTEYAALIVDLMLPGINGFELIRSVRSAKEVPIIVVSARTEDIDKIRGLDVGADDYLTKPFSPAELVARVQSHIRRYERLKGSRPTEEILSFRGLEIRHAARRVTVNGQEIQMTTKEYDLLYFLASNPNIVFTKEHLFNTVWGMDGYGDLATVPVHIQRIRKKIEKDPANPDYIETLWGTGYRFHG